MVMHAVAELPNECCGLLAGTPDGRVRQRYAVVNAAENRAREYLSEGKSMIAAHRDMRQQSIDLLGIYHSHPVSPPVPSRKDLERNFYGESVVHLIVSLQGKMPEVRAWWLSDTGFREAGWDISAD